MIDALRLGIFGWPVAHSKSPEMQLAAASALGIEMEYERFEVPPSDLAAAVQKKHGELIDGYNLTVPHKEAILTLLDGITPAAAAIGAVNTVSRTEESGYVGHNTDADGLVQALYEAEVSLAEARVVIVGAGGAARAAVVGLSDAGVGEIAVLARRPEQAEEMVEALEEHVGCDVEAAPLGEADWYFSTATLLVQATSATLESNPDAEAFAASLPIDSLQAGACVVDMVYKPLKTTVLARAEEHGCKILDGLGMLLHQGAIAFEMWTGQKPPIYAMREALRGPSPGS